MPSDTNSTAPWLREVADASAVIVKDGLDIRRQIASLVVRTYSAQGLALDDLGELVEAVLRGVVAGLAGKSTQARDQNLREVFEGLADAYAATAEHSRSTRQWNEMIDRVSASISDLAARAGEDVMTEFKRVADQLAQAGRTLRPKAAAAMEAIDRGVVEPAAEAATQGARKVRRTLSVLLAAAGELLHDLGETMKQEQQPAGLAASPSATPSPVPAPTRTAKTAAKPAARSKPRPQPSAKPAPKAAKRPAAPSRAVKPSPKSKTAKAPQPGSPSPSSAGRNPAATRSRKRPAKR